VVWHVPEAPPPAAKRRSLGRQLLGLRIWIYTAAILAILVLKLAPNLRSRVPRVSLPKNARMLTIAGLDLAPALIPRLVMGYRSLYPGIDVRVHSGGTREALQELANRQVDVAFLNRRPTPEEREAMRAVADSVQTYPIALGAMEVLSAREGGIDSVSVEDLKAWLQGEPGSGRPPGLHFYAPDPNLGLWASVTEALGLPESATTQVTWLAGEIEVARAVAADPSALGFAGTLSLVVDLERLGARPVRVRGETSARAVLPEPGEIARGDYPLYHYLYLACLPDPGAIASGFITIMYKGRGQRLVEREGVLPARQTARVIQLVQKPIGF
jgi:ABC-type phosphate transport system substrate-binding protein